MLLEREAVSGFAAGGGRVLAAVPTATGEGDELLRIDVATGETAVLPLPLPQPGFAVQLGVEASEELWGFRFEAAIDSADHSLDDVLHVGRGTGRPEPVLGLDGEPLRVLDWAFLPGRPALVAHGVDQTVLLIDLRPGRAPVPLGGHPALVSAGADGRSMVVSDDEGLVRHDLVSGAVAAIDFELDDGRIAYPSDAVVTDRLAVLSYSVVDPATHLFVQRVTAARPGGAPEVLYDSGDSGSTVTRVALSPNQRLVAVEVSDAATGTSSSRILDLGEGEGGGGARLLAQVDGSGGAWAG
jgi:hypothetical protein